MQESAGATKDGGEDTVDRWTYTCRTWERIIGTRSWWCWIKEMGYGRGWTGLPTQKCSPMVQGLHPGQGTSGCGWSAYGLALRHWKKQWPTLNEVSMPKLLQQMMEIKQIKCLEIWTEQKTRKPPIPMLRGRMEDSSPSKLIRTPLEEGLCALWKAQWWLCSGAQGGRRYYWIGLPSRNENARIAK